MRHEPQRMTLGVLIGLLVILLAFGLLIWTEPDHDGAGLNHSTAR